MRCNDAGVRMGKCSCRQWVSVIVAEHEVFHDAVDGGRVEIVVGHFSFLAREISTHLKTKIGSPLKRCSENVPPQG